MISVELVDPGLWWSLWSLFILVCDDLYGACWLCFQAQMLQRLLLAGGPFPLQQTPQNSLNHPVWIPQLPKLKDAHWWASVILTHVQGQKRVWKSNKSYDFPYVMWVHFCMMDWCSVSGAGVQCTTEKGLLECCHALGDATAGCLQLSVVCPQLLLLPLASSRLGQCCTFYEQFTGQSVQRPKVNRTRCPGE